ncbi:hypothetical protein NPS01_10150 [Nocardioides psychrotolerans]|nr:hypothetical protein NPS01_10150 [Nocardioides psychrotolerans]
MLRWVTRFINAMLRRINTGADSYLTRDLELDISPSPAARRPATSSWQPRPEGEKGPCGPLSSVPGGGPSLTRSRTYSLAFGAPASGVRKVGGARLSTSDYDSRASVERTQRG